MTSQPIDKQTTINWFRPLLEHRFVRFIKFGLVGGSGVVVNLLVFQLAFWAFSGVVTSPDWRHTIANLAGILVSIFTNFLLNDGWTWGDRQKGSARDWFMRLVRYYAACSIAALCQLGVSSGLYSMVFKALEPVYILGINIIPPIPLIIGIVCGMAINFPLSHFWAFKGVSTEQDEASTP